MVVETVDLQLEPWLRLGVFLAVLLLMMLAEILFPRRASQYRRKRWPANLLLVAFNTLVVRLIFSAATVTLALKLEAQNFGLLHWLGIPDGLNILLGIVLLDMVIYWQHRLSHSWRLLWRFHRTHHADTMIDVTTGARFHPLEIVFSMLVKLCAILILGPSVWAVIAFEIVLNATAMFNHSNINLPRGIDGLLRKILVTPDMHRVHHSVHADEYNSNFGFNLSIWDYFFRSYTAQPRDGHLAMQIGLPIFRDDQEASLLRLLTQPFRKPLS